MELFLGMGDDGADGGVARDIGRGSQHVEDPIHAEDEGDAFPWNTHGLKDDDQHDDPGPRYSSGADGGQHGGDDDGELVAHVQ